MKICKITDAAIIFDEGSAITYNHCQDCCEDNYADFRQLQDEAGVMDYDFGDLDFVYCEGAGFRFGDARRMFFVPCYSEQNGYYSTEIDIYYKGEIILSGDCAYI